MKRRKTKRERLKVRYTPYSETVRGTHPQGLMRAARHTIRSQMWNMPPCIPHISFQPVDAVIVGPKVTRRCKEDGNGNVLFEKTMMVGCCHGAGYVVI